MPAMSFHEDAVLVAAFTSKPAGTQNQVIVIIPTAHGEGGNDSILDGQRPAESDITLIWLTDLDENGQLEDEAPATTPCRSPSSSSLTPTSSFR